jgi:hypothetical protein
MEGTGNAEAAAVAFTTMLGSANGGPAAAMLDAMDASSRRADVLGSFGFLSF